MGDMQMYVFILNKEVCLLFCLLRYFVVSILFVAID